MNFSTFILRQNSISFVLPSNKYILKIKKMYLLEALRLKNIYSPQYLFLPSPFKYPLPMPSLLLVGGESRTVERITIPCTLQLTKLLRSSGLHQCGGVSTSFHLKASSERSCQHFTNFLDPRISHKAPDGRKQLISRKRAAMVFWAA